MVAIRAHGSKYPLFCVHGIGGHILPFLKLAEYLGPDQPFYGFQSNLPESESKDAYAIEIIAETYINELKGVQPSGPYFLTGFSFGGFVAYEIACQLKSRGDDIGLLAILDTRADSAPRYREALNFLEYAGYRLKAISERIDFHNGNTTGLPTLDKLKYLQNRGEQPSAREVILGDVDEEKIPDRMQGVMDSNISALRRYIPGRYNGDILLVRSVDHGKGNYYGWDELISGEVVIYDVPGNHRGILQEPNVSILASKLQENIAER